METIHRFEISKDINDVEMPVGAVIRSVGVSWKQIPDHRPTGYVNYSEKEVISIWAEVDTDAVMETRRFVVFGTGADITPITYYNPKYIGTVQKKNEYAFHIYEVDKEN